MIKKTNAFLYRLTKYNCIYHTNNFSTRIEAKRIDKDPESHSKSDIGKFYRINDREFKSIYQPQLKEDFTRLLNLFGDRSLLVRAPAVELMGYLQHADFSKPAIRYLLYGPTGNGKTVQMAHISHYAHRAGDWLQLYLPNTFNFLNFSPEMDISTRDSNCFDTPTLSVQFLQDFLELNSDFLKQYKPLTLSVIEWNQKEHLSMGSSWIDMINFAISRPKYSSDCVEYLLKEAQDHANQMEFKVLALVGGVHNLYRTSRRHDVTKRAIKPSRIIALRAWRQLVSQAAGMWRNGAVVCSLNAEMTYHHKPGSSWHPRVLLGDEGFKQMDPFVPILVEKYSIEETNNYLNFLNENDWLTVPSAQDFHGSGRREIRFLADGRPQELFRVTKEW